MRFTTEKETEKPWLFTLEELELKSYDGFRLTRLYIPQGHPVIMHELVRRERRLATPINESEMFARMHAQDQKDIIQYMNIYFTYSYAKNLLHDSDNGAMTVEVHKFKGVFNGKEGELSMEDIKDAKPVCFQLALNEIVFQCLWRDWLQVPESYAVNGIKILLSNPEDERHYDSYFDQIRRFNPG